ncbi:hypothetical protein Barb6XT_02848 [Bacteroidales bacterium Barb6XT]|nr:hypothetical protein Barb6XT_02848 [Bacteroidales bacterium Barb6XT]
MPLAGMTQKELSQKVAERINYEFVETDTGRIAGITGRDVVLSEKTELFGIHYNLRDLERLDFSGVTTV